MLAQDRDVVVIEPNLYRDVIFASQRLARGTCEIVEFSFGATDSDVSLDTSGIVPGDVVVAGGVAYEIMAMGGATDLTISRVREDREGPLVMPPSLGPLSFHVATIRPQLRCARELVLRMAGIPAYGEAVAGSPRAENVTNARDLISAQVYAALAMVYSALGAGQGNEGAMNQRAALMQRRFEFEAERTGVLVDLNGDGKPDAVRRLTGGVMVRG